MADLLMEMPVHYEPKRKNRFIVKLENYDIPEWVVHRANKPKYIFGKGWDEMVIELRDPIGPSTSQTLYEQLVAPALGEDLGEQKITYQMLDPVGVVVENWEIIGYYKEIDFGFGDYSKNELSIITVTFIPRECKLLF